MTKTVYCSICNAAVEVPYDLLRRTVQLPDDWVQFRMPSGRYNFCGKGSCQQTLEMFERRYEQRFQEDDGGKDTNTHHRDD